MPGKQTQNRWWPSMNATATGGHQNTHYRGLMKTTPAFVHFLLGDKNVLFWLLPKKRSPYYAEIRNSIVISCVTNVSQMFAHKVTSMVLWGTSIKISPLLKTIPSFCGLDPQRWVPGNLRHLYGGHDCSGGRGTWLKLGQWEPFLWDLEIGMIRDFLVSLWGVEIVTGLGSGWQTYVSFYYLETENKFAERERFLLVNLALLPVHPEVQLGSCPWPERTFSFFPHKALSSLFIFLKLAWWVTGTCSQQTPNWYMLCLWTLTAKSHRCSSFQ